MLFLNLYRHSSMYSLSSCSSYLYLESLVFSSSKVSSESVMIVLMKSYTSKIVQVNSWLLLTIDLEKWLLLIWQIKNGIWRTRWWILKMRRRELQLRQKFASGTNHLIAMTTFSFLWWHSLKFPLLKCGQIWCSQQLMLLAMIDHQKRRIRHQQVFFTLFTFS